MNDPIDLSEQSEGPEMSPDSEPDYPQVTMSNPGLVNFPNSGKSVIEHKVVRREHSVHGKGHKHRVTLQIKSIRPMGRKRSMSGHNPSENAMRDMMNEE